MLIGVSGQAGSGKDTVANYLVDNLGFVKLSFADPLKRICRDIFDFSEEQLWGPSYNRNKPDKRYIRMTRRGSVTGETDAQVLAELDAAAEGRPVTKEDVENKLDIYLTPRYALQTLGTEFGRNCYKNIWVEYALRLANTMLLEPTNYDYTSIYGLVPADRRKNPIQGVVIADCRFRNEMDLLRKAGAKLVRVLRPGAGLEGAAGRHQSESEQMMIPNSEFDAVIENDGTMEELHQKIADAYEKITD